MFKPGNTVVFNSSNLTIGTNILKKKSDITMDVFIKYVIYIVILY
jgi:hypothetical protein